MDSNNLMVQQVCAIFRMIKIGKASRPNMTFETCLIEGEGKLHSKESCGTTYEHCFYLYGESSVQDANVAEC